MERKIPEFGRFAEPSLLILVSLSDGPKHGYAMMQDIEAGTGRHTLMISDEASGAGDGVVGDPAVITDALPLPTARGSLSAGLLDFGAIVLHP